MTSDTAVSTAVTPMEAIGNTSRGQYTLFRSATFERMLVPPPDTPEEKKLQGISPKYANNGYGAPPVSTLTILWKKTVKTTIITNGVRIAQTNPSTACL